MSAFKIFVRFQLKEKNKNQGLSFVNRLIKNATDHDGCVDFELLEKADHHGHYYLISSWENELYFNDYMKSEQFHVVVRFLARYFTNIKLLKLNSLNDQIAALNEFEKDLWNDFKKADC